MSVTAPIKNTADIKRMVNWLNDNADEAFSLICMIGTSTGYRITDITNFQWENINFDERTVTIKESKGTKAAKSRAKGNEIRKIKAEQLNIISTNRASDAIDKLNLLYSSTKTDDIEKAIYQVVDKGTAKVIQKRIADAKATAKPKIRTADLSKDVIKRLKARFEKFGAIDGGFIFNSNTVNSNRAKNSDSVISRQSCWRLFKAAGDAISTVKNIIKGSCHGLRKTYARLLYTQNGNDLGETIKQMGWSSAEMALKYLGFDTETRKRSSANVHAVLA